MDSGLTPSQCVSALRLHKCVFGSCEHTRLLAGIASDPGPAARLAILQFNIALLPCAFTARVFRAAVTLIQDGQRSNVTTISRALTAADALKFSAVRKTRVADRELIKIMNAQGPKASILTVLCAEEDLNLESGVTASE